MVLPTVFLIHSVDIIHVTGWGEDEYGQPAPITTTTTGVSCRFVGAKETMGVTDGSYIKSVPHILFPPGTIIEDNDTLTSTVEGFTGMYQVNAKSVIYEAATNDISHIACEIAAVV